MPHKINIEEHFLEPPYNIVETIAEYGDQQDRNTNVQADVTHWHLQNDGKFNCIIDKINEIYPTHTIEELWGCTYRQGDYTTTHHHYGYDRAFVWFVDTHSSSPPLIFPDTDHPWLPPLRVIQPEKGKIYVFEGRDWHYVPPVTDGHKRVTMSGNMKIKEDSAHIWNLIQKDSFENNNNLTK